MRIGPTQTLAKLANHLAKPEPAWDGVCNWGALAATDQETRLAGLDVAETWAMRQEHCSPAYTTRWEDLPVGRAG